MTEDLDLYPPEIARQRFEETVRRMLAMKPKWHSNMRARRKPTPLVSAINPRVTPLDAAQPGRGKR